MSAHDAEAPLSSLEYHVLLATARGPIHGYALRHAVESESDGAQRPGAGSLYRVLARLLASGLVAETEAPDSEPRHPGHARRYYRLTTAGRKALAGESRRLRSVAALAARRLGALEEEP
jgi:DNA-binding PadR family transcriptional regulator